MNMRRSELMYHKVHTTDLLQAPNHLQWSFAYGSACKIPRMRHDVRPPDQFEGCHDQPRLRLLNRSIELISRGTTSDP